VAVVERTCDGSDRAKGSTTASTTTGPPCAQGLQQSFPNVAGLFDANPCRAHGLGDFGEIGVFEFHAEGDNASLLLSIDEVKDPLLRMI